MKNVAVCIAYTTLMEILTYAYALYVSVENVCKFVFNVYIQCVYCAVSTNKWGVLVNSDMLYAIHTERN